MAEIQSIPEMYTEGIDAAGVTRQVKMRMRVVMDDGTERRICFGDCTWPDHAEAEQMPEFRFPEDFLNLAAADDILYSLAVQAALEKLRHPG